MIEDLDNNDNYQEDLPNQDNFDSNQQIQLNPNRKKILPNRNKDNNNNNDSFENNGYNPNENEFNQNENDFDQNENNNMGQPTENFQYDNERNVTEIISNKAMGHIDKCLQYIGKYFNVEYNDLKQRLKAALIPFNKNFFQNIENKADLYGPFWTFTTIIFLISFIGNISSYIHCEDKPNFVYNYNHVPHAIFIIYGFGFGAPFLLWIISKVFKTDIDLITHMCVYGYSYVILIPILLLCIIPFKLISTLALLYFLIHSCTFLLYNMFLIVQQKNPGAKYIILGLLGGVQILLFLLLKFYFF